MLEVIGRYMLARCEEGLCECESSLKTRRVTLKEGASCHGRPGAAASKGVTQKVSHHL